MSICDLPRLCFFKFAPIHWKALPRISKNSIRRKQIHPKNIFQLCMMNGNVPDLNEMLLTNVAKEAPSFRCLLLFNDVWFSSNIGFLQHPKQFISSSPPLSHKHIKFKSPTSQEQGSSLLKFCQEPPKITKIQFIKLKEIEKIKHI